MQVIILVHVDGPVYFSQFSQLCDKLDFVDSQLSDDLPDSNIRNQKVYVLHLLIILIIVRNSNYEVRLPVELTFVAKLCLPDFVVSVMFNFYPAR